MSLSDSHRNNVEKRQPAPLRNATVAVDSYQLLQKAIQQLPLEIRNSIILRCDLLARLQISEEALEKVFVQLLEIITEDIKTDDKLFLHITCSAASKGEERSAASRYNIQFHTNASPFASSVQQVEQKMNLIVSLLSPFQGSLEINQLKNSGSVFIIGLPGK
jgi:hypothetical protein